MPTDEQLAKATCALLGLRFHEMAKEGVWILRAEGIWIIRAGAPVLVSWPNLRAAAMAHVRKDGWFLAGCAWATTVWFIVQYVRAT